MKNSLNTGIILALLLLVSVAMADKEGMLGTPLSKGMEISDRAYGIHNASNISLFFTNYGVISWGSFANGNAGEFPTNSNHHYLYLMCPMVGVAPDADSGRPANVITSRYPTATDWNPLPGYHQPPATDIAFSDNPATWPNSVWPLQNEAGDAVIKSSQDSYCVYNDDNNTTETLGIQVAQTGYAFGLSDFEDMIFFTFEITNTSATTYDSVYFGLYHDFDVGNDPGGENDYSDDALVFDKDENFLYVYDSDHSSPEWGQAPGMMGIAFFETPEIDGTMAGITDMHYGIFENSEDIQMTLLSSNLDYLPDGVDGTTFFNTGAVGNKHYDDPSIIASTGADIYGTISSGPYDLSTTDTLTYVIGLIAGVDENDLHKNLQVAKIIYADDFVTPKPPKPPALSGIAGHNRITLYWTNELQAEVDELSGDQDFEGYNLYRSDDGGASWDGIDRNTYPEIGPDPVPLVSYDRVNGLGNDAGLQYTYIDEDVLNGIEYWYSITAFDQGDDLIASLESPLGNSPSVDNVISITPVSTSAGYTPDAISGLSHYDGSSTYALQVTPVESQLSTYTYELRFLYAIQKEIGNSGIWATIDIIDSSKVGTLNYGIRFTAADQIDIIDIDTQAILWYGGLYPGYPYPFDDQFILTFFWEDTTQIPEQGELISLNFSAELLRYDGHDTVQVIAPQRFEPGVELVSSDGLIINMEPQDQIQNLNIPPSLDMEVDLEVANVHSLQEMDYQITVTGTGTDSAGATYIIIQTTDKNASIVRDADTLSTGESIYFRGVLVEFSFNEGSPPTVGTVITFSTLPIIPPSIEDYYSFGIAEGQIDDGLLADEMSNIRVVPNPYMAGSIWESEMGSYVREPEKKIQFTNLPGDCEIRIFTLAGDLIKTLEHNATHGTETWDLRAEGGREIVSGVYLYQVKSASHEYVNRFAVIK